jgi:hypothetical protein
VALSVAFANPAGRFASGTLALASSGAIPDDAPFERLDRYVGEMFHLVGSYVRPETKVVIAVTISPFGA